MILYGLLGIIIIIIIAAAIGSKDAQKKALNAGGRIKAMELKYENYIKKHIRNSALEAQHLPIDSHQLALDSLTIIRGDLEGLIALINSTTYSNVHINYMAEYFPNVVALTEDYFRQSRKNQSRRLTEIEKETFRQTALDAIQADIQKRLLDINIDL